MLKIARLFLTGFCFPVTAPAYAGPTYPSWLSRHASLPWVDAIACRHDQGLSVIVVNRSDRSKALISIQLPEGTLQLDSTDCDVFTLGGHPDTKNTFDSRPVTVKRSREKFTGAFDVQPSSLVVYALSL